MSEAATSSPSLERLWGPCLESPQDEQSHETFITFAIESGHQMAAIDKYNELEARAKESEDAALEALAKSYKAKIANRVAVKLLASASSARDAEIAERHRRQAKKMAIAGGLCLIPALIPVPLVRGLALVVGASLIFGALYVYGRRNAS